MVFDARQTLDQRFRRLERRFVMTLIFGFGLVLIMMVASGVIGLRAMSRIDTEADAMSGRFLRDTKLIDRLVQKQSTLGVLIYSLAGEQGDKSLATLAKRFEVERQRLLRLTDEALSLNLDQDERNAWQTVRDSAHPLHDELQSLVSQRKHNSPALSAHYERLTEASTRLMEAAYADAARSRTTQLARDAGELQSARNLFVLALGLAGLFAVISGWLAVSWFETLKRQAATLADLSLHTLAEHEDNARRFSQEMHDEFGQTLNAIGSNLAVAKPLDDDSAERLRDSLALVKEAQAAARDLSQLLRPRILDDFGLDAGLRELARGFSQRTGIVVEYRSHVRERLASPVETHLFRIAQEALTNTARHSVATDVKILLDKAKDLLVLAVKDNGQGFPAGNQEHLGLGFLGMRERVRAIGGRLEVHSRPGDGVAIRVELPLAAAAAAGEVGA
ncbi:MAG: hypothetical protein IT162_22915 [Bryobacterales bacterium]|nr:hypothetical protein [Bryobacterales bacterium]